jgi:hypothetical protein
VESRVAIEDRLGGGPLGLEDWPVGHLAVPLHQGRDRSALGNDAFEQLPDAICDRAVMTVNQEEIAFIVRLLGVTGQMDFPDVLQWKITKIGRGCIAMLVADTKTLLTSRGARSRYAGPERG